MRKIFAIGFVIIIAVFLLLRSLGKDSLYVAEARLWKTNERFAHVIDHPEATPETVYRQLAGRYRGITHDFRDNPLVAINARIQLGKVYMAQKDFARARKELQEIFSAYPDQTNALAEAALTIGKTYEFEDNWPEAQRVYEKIITEYPKTPVALRLPLYIAQHYRDKGLAQKAEDAFRDATAHYTELLQRDPDDQQTIFEAMEMLARVAIAREDWPAALNRLEAFLMRFPKQQTLLQTLQSINTVAVVKLHQPEEAVRIYTTLLEQNPEHPLRAVIEQMVTGLAKMQEAQDVKNKKQAP